MILVEIISSKLSTIPVGTQGYATPFPGTEGQPGYSVTFKAITHTLPHQAAITRDMTFWFALNEVKPLATLQTPPIPYDESNSSVSGDNY